MKNALLCIFISITIILAIVCNVLAYNLALAKIYERGVADGRRAIIQGIINQANTKGRVVINLANDEQLTLIAYPINAKIRNPLPKPKDDTKAIQEAAKEAEKVEDPNVLKEKPIK